MYLYLQCRGLGYLPHSIPALILTHNSFSPIKDHEGWSMIQPKTSGLAHYRYLGGRTGKNFQELRQDLSAMLEVSFVSK